MRKAIYGAGAGLAALVASGAAMAKDETATGMPQLDPNSFAPQLVWLAIAFLALYIVMSKFAMPAISDTLERRQAKIQGDLDAAEKANEETRSLIAAYEKRLADTREEARKLMRERGEADSAAAAARLNALNEKLAAQIGEAEKRIAGQRDDVMAGLESMAKDIGQEVYAKLAGQPADPSALSAKVAAAAAQGTRGGGSR
jgi:F-type H+-transporting ATPase subunit b